MSTNQSNRRKSAAQYLCKTVEDLDALFFVDGQGNILEQRIRKSFGERHKLPWMEHVATPVSVRFKLAKFDKLPGGLEMTFNVFKNGVMIVKPFEADEILFMLFHETKSI